MTDDDAPHILVLNSSDPDDRYKLFRQLLYPTRIDVLDLIHGQREISASEIEDLLGLKFHAVQVSLGVLTELGLISVELQTNPGHGQQRIARSLIPKGENVLNIEIILQYVGGEIYEG